MPLSLRVVLRVAGSVLTCNKMKQFGSFKVLYINWAVDFDITAPILSILRTINALLVVLIPL